MINEGSRGGCHNILKYFEGLRQLQCYHLSKYPAQFLSTEITLVLSVAYNVNSNED